ncbi:M4 family metallopeptidase [Subtercola boreus]|uniref:Neutral metalloproteinase n=1 Tax=Subtercola boreus TaxID=120213 RepID=A0A3E0W8J4_9MICO|nr:M4 family metallopeptidase [Subtercola boreus]RFA19260.1 peptidase M4 family protein [Subtercola boreus]RFA19520.1 peptidase M4 family protein [Subtercola boreus]RFA25886.1 peptidase M4 family protein [Subtercola boreus]
MIHSIVPPYLLEKIAQTDDERMVRAATAARRALLARDVIQEARTTPTRPTQVRTAQGPASGLDRTIFDAHNTEDLPGTRVREEGSKVSADVTVNEAYDGLGATYDLYRTAFGRDSVDGKGLPLLATVHYGTGYDNAYWDGERMVFGDGDGEVFGRFTASVSVIGHELSHGVTQFTAGLDYQGQSGALNESYSDVMGALVEQFQKKQTAAEASWLIGQGLFTPAVKGEALRSMLNPGTAYDDPVLGKDPQPADMAHYVETTDDNGGVHLNSGIPNRAFALAAIEIGGDAWLGAGQVWYDTITGPLAADADFAAFARATVAAATARFGAGSAETEAVGTAWVKVGVLTNGATS